MMTTDKPCLCGGTFFVLLLRAKRSRAKKEVQKLGNGGVTNPELLKSLIMFFDPDYVAPAGTTLETNTSLYKSCDISNADCLPFSDTALVNAFNRKIETAYSRELSHMKLLADFFLTTEKPAKIQELVYGVLNLIKDDESIEYHDRFYALPDGTSVSKAKLCTLTEINLYALLLGVWHFILMYRRDNSIGKSTLADWLRPPVEKGDKYTFVSTIGDEYHLSIKISTTCDITDDANIVDSPCSKENPDIDFIEAECLHEISFSTQPPTAVTQNIHNQFNINQNGNGINVGYAEKVEIRDGKVVTLK